MRINAVIGSILLLGLGACSQPLVEPKASPPNIVMVYLDDMGYGDLTLTGATGFSTPNIDQMAQEGMLFTHFYAPQAVCSPSRAGLLTGCYPNRIGFSGALDHRSEYGLHPDEMTMAEMLKAEGYATAIFGKWHLGYQLDFLPLQHGFDEFYGIPYSNDMWPYHPQAPEYYPPLPLIQGNDTLELNPDQRYFTRNFTERTIDFIERNSRDPFFVYLAHPMPHVPLFVSEDFIGRSEQGLYGDVMMELDWSVGEVLNAIDALGLSENTLVIFTSDNGPWLNYGNHAGSTGGLREGKGGTFEGGQRVPCVMKWEGVIPPGKICNKITSAIDLLPTIADLVGAEGPSGIIDGLSLVGLLDGSEVANPRTEFFYYYGGNSLQAVRMDNWKLVLAHRGRSYEGYAPGDDGKPGEVAENFQFEKGLYDLRRDPGEIYNVIEWYPEIAQELEALAMKARKDLGDDLTGFPGENRRPAGRIVN